MPKVVFFFCKQFNFFVLVFFSVCRVIYLNKTVVEEGNFRLLIAVMCFVGPAYKGYPLTSLHSICTSVPFLNVHK